MSSNSPSRFGAPKDSWLVLGSWFTRKFVSSLRATSASGRRGLNFTRGLHLYFRHPGGELPTRIGLGNGLDLKGDGGYVVAPPSKHPSGANYEWIISPDDAGLAELPEWVMEQIRMHGRKAKAEDVGETIANGSRNKTLFS